MAKKGKTEGVLARETRLRAEAEAAEVEAADAAREAERAARAAEATKQAAEASRAGSGLKRAAKAKAAQGASRARFVRAKKEPRPEAAPAPLPPPSGTPSGRMLSKNVKAAPKGEVSGPNRGRTAPAASRS